MALQVWLPFTDGTLKQQGLSSSTVTQTGTINLTNTGKLGRCATFTTTAGRLNLPTSVMTSFTECSVTLWLNVTAWNTGWDTIFQAGLGSTAWNNYIFGILRNNNSTLACTISNGSTTSSGSYASSTLSTGTWIHLAFTYSTGKIKIYINGTLDKEYSTSIVPNFAGITYITIGNTNSSSYQCNCKMNDFRIYDHCLSPMEVKELAKGLVLHYPLNRQGWGQENLVWNSNWNVHSTTPPESWVNWGSPPTREIVTIDGKNWLHVISNTTQFQGYSQNWTKRNGVGELTANTKMTVSFTAKLATAASIAPIGIHWCNSSGTIVTQNWTTTALTTSPKRYSFTYTTPADCVAFNIMVGDNTNTAHEVWVTDIKLEFGEIATPWCPNSSDTLATTMGLNSTTEYDCSGFCNNGIRTGTFTWTSDTSKYAVSTTINSSKIQCITNPITGDDPIFSIGFWFKLKSNISYIAYADLVSFSSSSYSNQPFRLEICGNPVGNDICWFRGPSGNTGGFKINTSNLVRDTWYHTVLVSEGNKQYSYYINGIKTGTYNGSANSWTPTNIFSIGDGQAGAFDISDVRIYATALSADDVKSLYQNCATIDSDGTIRGQIRS